MSSNFSGTGSAISLTQLETVARQISESLFSNTLHSAGFTELMGQFERIVQPDPLCHIVELCISSQNELTIRLNVAMTQISELIIDSSDFIEERDLRYATVAMRHLPLWPETADGLQLTDIATIAEHANQVMRDEGMAFLDQWDSAENLLAAIQTGTLTPSVEQTAALHYLVGQSAHALAILDARLAEIERLPALSNKHPHLHTMRERIADLHNELS